MDLTRLAHHIGQFLLFEVYASSAEVGAIKDLLLPLAVIPDEINMGLRFYERQQHTQDGKAETV